MLQTGTVAKCLKIITVSGLLLLAISGCNRAAVEEESQNADEPTAEQQAEEVAGEATLQTYTADDFRDLFDQASTWYEVTSEGFALEHLWDEHNRRSSVVREDLLSGVRTVPGYWRLLVIADESDPDAPFTIPYLASLSERVRNLDFKLLERADLDDLLIQIDPDGETARASMILLNDDYEPVGCRPLRPDELLQLERERAESLTDTLWMLTLKDWYMGNRAASQVSLMNLVKSAGDEESDCPIRFE